MIDLLAPEKKLVDAVADWLIGKIRVTAYGAKTLSHLLVIVPTAQAGRSLRLTLAKKAAALGWGGILPPKVVLPFTIIAPADQSISEATEAEVSAIYLKFAAEKNPNKDKDAVFTELDHMADIWHILTSKGLVMRDVVTNEKARAVLEAAMGNELERWEELARKEAEFFAFLKSKGLRHHAEAVSLAKSTAAPLPEGIEEIVLPALADPSYVLADVLEQFKNKVKITTLLHAEEKDAELFDEWGRPKEPKWIGKNHPILGDFSDEDIFSYPDSITLAEGLVKDFPKKDANLALPSLGLCDAELYTEVSAAFLNNGFELHNPERNRLVISSLGRLVKDLISAWRPGEDGLEWNTFVSLLRSDDILKELKAENLIESRAAELEKIDKYQNEHIPGFVTSGFSLGSKALLKWLEEAREASSLSEYLRSMLEKIFTEKYFGDARAEKEFSEAAKCVRDIIASFESPSIKTLDLSDSDIAALARKLLKSATYSLESDSSEVVKTEGWLELAWSSADKIALVGLHEGAVPDSVVGHPFLPNELREALGLTTNATRLARDSWLLKELVSSHRPHSIRAYVSRTNGKGDICRPSRLLFLCEEAELPERVKNLFGDSGELPLTPPREVSEKWRPNLLKEVPLRHNRLSSSAIDLYLASPLMYLLRYGLGMRDKYEDKKELDFNDFGSFIHHVLERYAKERKPLETLISEESARFGEHLTANLRLQHLAAKERLMRFAELQADWEREGWRVEAAEIPFEVKPFEDLDVTIKGSVDRVDYRLAEDGEKEYRIIDYKSWDDFSKVGSHIKAQSEDEIKFADALNLPTIQKKNTRIRLKTTQLPLYGKCLEALDPEKYKGRISEYDYLVLAEDKIATFSVKEFYEISLETAHKVIERILENRFTPMRPSEKSELYDFASLFSVSPEHDLGGEANA